MSFENELLDFIMFEEITGGFDEEDKEAINDSIYDLFEDDEGSSLNEQGVVHQMNTNNI